MVRRSRGQLWMVIGCCALLFLSACGRPTQASNSAQKAGAAQENYTEVDVELDSFKITPSLTTIKAGEVHFEVSNIAIDQIHEMLVVQADGPLEALPYDLGTARLLEDKITSLGEVTDLDPGKGKELILDLKPGKYLLLCNLTQHFKSGMVTPIVVK